MEILSFEEILSSYPIVDEDKGIHRSASGQHLQIHQLEIHSRFDQGHLMPYFEASQQVHHDNLVPVIAAFLHKKQPYNNYYWLTPLIASKEDLDISDLPQEQKDSIGLQLLSAVTYLHNKGFHLFTIDSSHIQFELKYGSIHLHLLQYNTTPPLELIQDYALLAPEHLNTNEFIDARSDLWIIGVILFWTQTGMWPFGHRNQKTSNQQIAERITKSQINNHLNSVKEPFQSIISKCLNVSKMDRWSSVQDISVFYKHEIVNPTDTKEHIEPLIRSKRNIRKKSKPIHLGFVIFWLVLAIFLGYILNQMT